MALMMALSRGIITWAGTHLSGRLARDPPTLLRWGWSGLVSQAGLALGLSVLVAREFPAIGTGFRALAISTIAVNELVGPILFKLALGRTGETSRVRAPSFPSVPPPQPHV